MRFLTSMEELHGLEMLLQTRSVVGVAGVAEYWPAPHVETFEQVWSVVAVARVEMYWSTPHAVTLVHTRSVDAVAARDCHCSEEQTRMGRQGSRLTSGLKNDALQVRHCVSLVSLMVKKKKKEEEEKREKKKKNNSKK
jgi:hypothetical protein